MNPSGYVQAQCVFDGPSNRLVHTIIVPTLDTPIPDGKNVIWCGSFQLAWNELKSKVAGEPIRLKGAQEVADRLNSSSFAATELADGSYYAAAGFVRDRIVERITNDMRGRFPSVNVPDFGFGNIAVAYAYLEATVSFQLPYYEADLDFRGVKGGISKVKGFGIRQQEANAAQSLRSQIDVLFAGIGEGPIEFGLDLDKSSTPNQIVVARIPRRGTLAETIAELQQRINQEVAKPSGYARFGLGDMLLVPAMHWKIEHDFAEMTGQDKILQNQAFKGAYLDKAQQTIRFKLDKSGADLKAEAHINAKSGSRFFYLDEPYLIVMKKRGAKEPFFAMWVDNPELMVK